MRFFSKIIPSLARDFRFFVIAVLIIMLFAASLVIAVIYQSHVENRNHRLELKAAIVDRTLNESIDYIEYLLTFAGNQIADNEAKDKQYIATLIAGFRYDLKAKSISSWSMLDWVDTDKKLVAASTLGVLKVPVDLSMRSTLTSALKEPWKFFVGEPANGAISGQQIIPLSMGVADKTGKPLGALHVALTVSGLTDKIEQSFENSGFKFVVLNKNDEIILQSPFSPIPLRNDFFKNVATNKFVLPSGYLSTPINANHFSYAAYKISSRYPYVIIVGYDPKLDNNELKEKLLLPLILCCAFGMVAITLLYYFHHRIITPIVQLADTAGKITQGDYSLRSLYGGGGEVRKLSEAFNGMLEKIEEDKNTLEERVAERTASLQDALNVRHDFLNHLSHEIRTPVSSIHARSDILLEMWDDFNHVELKESIQDIQRNSLQVCALVTNLLDLSKSRAGKMVYAMQEHDVALIAAQVVEECRPLYSQKSLQLTMENTAEHTVALCDATRIGQVIRNLLSNACRYTPAGRVQLVISDRDMYGEDGRVVPSIALSVTDEGIGIPENEQHKIFESFTQSSRTNTKAGGTGLGLAIALEIITAHHGQIWAENNKAGKGCSFIFLIPRQWSYC